MSSTYGQRKDVSLRSYVSVNPFNTQLFSYTVSVNAQLQTVGTLAVVAGATALNCPVGRLLAETGKKIFPGVNVGVETPMVSVYDAVSGLTGFIDPNAAVFTVYSTDKPYFQQRGVDPVGDLTDNGMPIYTNGDIITKYGDVTVLGGNVNVAGDIDLSGSLTIADGDIDHLNGNVNIADNVDISGSLTAGRYRVSPRYITATTGAINAGSASSGVATFPGNSATLVVTTSACTSNSHTKYSLVFLTGTGAATLRATVANGSFTITSTSATDGQAVSWLVVN